jgi:hypothetical protein
MKLPCRPSTGKWTAFQASNMTGSANTEGPISIRAKLPSERCEGLKGGKGSREGLAEYRQLSADSGHSRRDF